MKKTKAEKKILSMPDLETKRLKLRKLTTKDVSDVYEYSSREEVPKYLTWEPHESLKYTKRYLRFLVSKYRSGEYLDWAIVLKSNGKVIGTCGFTSVDPLNSKCEIGYVLNSDYWNNGYATEAVNRIMDYAFSELEVNRIEARVMEGNTASSTVLKKCKMDYEGTFRQEILVKGEFKNIMHFSRLKNN